MATVSVTIPDAIVPALVAVATSVLQEQGQDTSGTNLQIARRYIAQHLRLLYETSQTRVAESTAQTTIQTARATARTAAEGIS